MNKQSNVFYNNRHIALGIGVGLALGAALGNVAAGLALGIALGGIGALWKQRATRRSQPRGNDADDASNSL